MRERGGMCEGEGRHVFEGGDEQTHTHCLVTSIVCMCECIGCASTYTWKDIISLIKSQDYVIQFF